jgi:hypothetical protein
VLRRSTFIARIVVRIHSLLQTSQSQSQDQLSQVQTL